MQHGKKSSSFLTTQPVDVGLGDGCMEYAVAQNGGRMRQLSSTLLVARPTTHKMQSTSSQ
jgi:hypothetical protein